jgi:hypothetical protein
VSSDSRTSAFQLLRDIVTEYYGGGRRTFAAALKPELQRRTFGGFNEILLGFPTFRHFLFGARDEGFVQLELVGDDLAALPVGQPAPLPRFSVRPIRPGSGIRPELWRAFVDWTPGLMRLYSKATDEVVSFPEIASSIELTEHTRAREAYRTNPTAFVSISPISREVTLDWMRRFAASLEDHTARVALEAALGTDRPIGAFSALVRLSPTLAQSWHRFRQARVAAQIAEWSRAKGLELKIMEGEEERRPESPSEVPAEKSEEERVATLRQRVHIAVDRMPLGDLLRLAIPLEYIVDS